jgi:hypothetical protein
MFTDGEIGLKMAYDRNTRALTAHAQSMIDGQSAEIAALATALAAARAEVRVERAKRLAAELRLERVLDMPA